MPSILSSTMEKGSFAMIDAAIAPAWKILAITTMAKTASSRSRHPPKESPIPTILSTDVLKKSPKTAMNATST